MRTLVSALAVAAMIAAAADTATAQLVNPGFEDNVGAPNGWTLGSGSLGQTLTAVDAGFPTEGANYFFLWNFLTGPATPHGNPGGFGTEATGTATLSQTFQLGSASFTNIEFDCLFMSNDVNNDFLEASITDGSQVLNLVHLDVSDVGPGPSTIFALPTTLVTHVSVDLGAHFVGATPQTPFTLTLHCGNRNDTNVASRANFDNFVFSPGTSLTGDSIDWSKPDPNTVLCEVHTAMPNTEWISMLSDNTSGPVGTGPILGLHPSPAIFEILTLPLGFPCVHETTNSNGDYFFSLPSFLFPPGFAFDYLLVTILPGPTVGTITLPKRISFP